MAPVIFQALAMATSSLEIPPTSANWLSRKASQATSRFDSVEAEYDAILVLATRHQREAGWDVP